MAKKMKEKIKFVRNKPHCNIGTIGHVDHGKTTLTAAITKALASIGKTKFKDYGDIDFHPEERARGITINAAHVEYETEKRHYSHIDCPGHQDYIKNMIIGATHMEGVILVVSAVDGVQVQTKEHVILAKEIGIPYMIVYLNKVDAMKERSMLDIIELEVRELIESYGFSEETPFIRGSAKNALEGDEDELKKIRDMMSVIDDYVKEPTRNLEGNFLMSIENIHVSPGRGTVVTGKVEEGKISINDEVEVVARKNNYKTICLGLETYNQILDYAIPGDNIGVLLKGVPNKEINKGDVLCTPNTMKRYTTFLARAYIQSKKEGGRSKPFASGYKPQFFFRVSNVTGTIKFDKEEDLGVPGEQANFRVILFEKSVINVGLKFVIREGKLTIGAGVITSIIE